MRGSRSARVLARLLVACAVVAGVFAMHGLPEQTCAGGSGTGQAASAMVMGHGPVRVTVGDSAPRTVAVEHGADGMGYGSVCVFTSPLQGWAASLALLLATAFAVGAFTPALNLGWRRRRPSHRGPPTTGSRLLTTLCVSRT